MFISSFLSFIITKSVSIISIILLIRCIFSWLPYEFRYSLFGKKLYTLTEPFLSPIRKFLPATPYDFSPLILMVIVIFLRNILLKIINF